MPSVAVLGAGISGLTCARALADRGYSVTVFEKSRGAGGRMSTRRAAHEMRFDHGAQYFTVRDLRFSRRVESWIREGVVAPWRAPIVVLDRGAVMEKKTGTDRFVAVPGMNAICKSLSADLHVRYETRIDGLQHNSGSWSLSGESADNFGTFDFAVISAPANQTAHLLNDVPALAARVRQVEMRACWAVMLAFTDSLEVDFGGAFVHNSPLSWVACNSSKPGRSTQPETWVLHATSTWSHAHLEDSTDSVGRLLTDAFWCALRLPAREALFDAAHRWLFASPSDPLVDRCLVDVERKIAACGDWCGGPRVEGAFLSGVSAASRVSQFFENCNPLTKP